MRQGPSPLSVLGLILLFAIPSYGAHKKILPLKDVLAIDGYIFAAKVEKVDPAKPAAVFVVTDTLKGKAKIARIPINLTGDTEAKREQQTEKLLKRLAPDLALIMFVTRQGDKYLGFVYTNGTWFQIIGQGESEESLRWSFAHLEPYLRRTFKGTTDELRQIVVDGLAGKREPPKPNEKEPPGIGPEIEEKPKQKPNTVRSNPLPSVDSPAQAGDYQSTNLPLAVIPTFVVIGPLAILATLFPAVFGGLALLMRRWMVALTLSSLLSTVYFLQKLFYNTLQGTWLGNSTGMWFTFGLLSVAAALWASRRYRRAVVNQEADAWLPNKWDRIVLIGSSIVGVAAVGVALYLGRALFRAPWLDVLATFAPVWVTSIALVFYSSRAEAAPGSSLESVFLWSVAIACGLVAALEAGRTEERGRSRTVAANLEIRSPRLIQQPVWKFEPSGSGMILSSPCIADGKIYVGALVGAGFSQHGRVFCIDSETGAEVWSFDDNKGLKGMFSSPCVWNGKVYFGEGFHEDRDCRVICLNAKSGAKVWEKATTSHTESAPVVVDGKLYIGAGDDGLYCLNAEDGKQIWHVENLHIDANPVVQDGCVHVGSGVGDIHKTTVLLCLNAADGKEKWRIPLEYPTFATVNVFGGRLFVGMGNGNYSESDPSNPRGLVLCVDAANGKRVWQFDARDAILSKPAVDDANVWFTCRDGLVYCVRRSDGRLRWKYDAKAPVVSSPILVNDGDGAVVRSLYVAGSDGVLACLDPDRGTPFWAMDLAGESKQPKVLVDATPAILVRQVDGVERRSLFVAFGAGQDISQLSTSLPRLYRIEDEVK